MENEIDTSLISQSCPFHNGIITVSTIPSRTSFIVLFWQSVVITAETLVKTKHLVF